ncbi:hypothetical protein E4T80_11190 [Muribacter muris]|uniref:Antitoxin VbhA domain-containing protein n=1 Tax=Muribacter muris TaxID=67855 RepID=A0A4Y9JRH0_9PAST|nr:antitoxin VbhA family protein [Muribacter muris]MBF0786029.1 antitoxin VbhA family protein [Muribacter muris]MBF0826793.1 antitoxin VbhA family protein [Muribacter muris]TFV08158.1 hypothetical protein E4T80_11190 [Muribacter muris]
MISQEERNQRQKAVQFALDNNRLEGLDMDEDVLALSQEWIDGIISYQEFREKVYEIHGI